MLESLTKTDFDNERIAKGVSVKVAHKIGDADEFEHDTGVVYADSPLCFLFLRRILIMIRFLR